MAYDEALAERVRDLLHGQEFEERRMFGGLGWMTRGNMALAALSDGDLMVRVHADDQDALSAEEGASPMVMREHPMRGWIRLDPQALADPEALAVWVERGMEYAATLPPK
jgi:TfoX/Sxy family transcriptional regulator of competence genes